MDIRTLITIDPDILGGTPVFAGTRVPIQTLFDHLETQKAFGAFESDKDADEIIAEIRNSRTVTRQIESF